MEMTNEEVPGGAAGEMWLRTGGAATDDAKTDAAAAARVSAGGGMNARKVSAKYGMSQQAIYTRFSHKGKRVRAGIGVVAPAPLDPLAAMWREVFAKMLAMLPPPKPGRPHIWRA